MSRINALVEEAAAKFNPIIAALMQSGGRRLNHRNIRKSRKQKRQRMRASLKKRVARRLTR
jgi:hypothetical protein